MRNLITIVLLVVSTVATAQHDHHHKDKPSKEEVKAMKIAYLTDKLELTPQEAEKFWPVYNEYQGKKDEIRKKAKEHRKAKKENTSPTDAEVEEMIQMHFSMKQKSLDLDKQYYSEFKNVLPIQKVGKFYRAEEQFKRELLKKIRGNRNHHPRGGHPQEGKR